MFTNFIKNIQSVQAKVLFIRHAERFPIDDMKDALSIKLTPKGHEDAIVLGKQLAPLGPFELFHSPVPRCGETARRITEGLNSQRDDSTLKGQQLELGGPYVHGDWKELVHRTRELGPSQFIREWFDTEKHDDLMVPLKDAAIQSLDFLSGQLHGQGSQVINITHDWNIMILREYFFQITHERYGMPPFLDGIALFRKNNKTYLSYHDNEIEV